MWFALILAMLLPLVSLSPAQLPTCVIEGRVGNLISGGPVRKAKVLLGIQGNSRYQTVTDNNGHYAIAGVAPGKYTLWVQRTGFLPVVYGAHGPNRPGKSIVLQPGDNRRDLNFVLEAPGVITGHVYDQDGEPLSTAVILYRESWRNGRKQIQQAGGANADDEGMYRLFGLSAGTYVVGTSPTAFRPASPVPTSEIYPSTFYPSTEDSSSAISLKLTAGSEARNIDIRVRKTNSVNLSGTLVAKSLTPDLRVTLLRRDGFPDSPNNMMFPQPGQFAARRITPGSYVLTARSPAEYARMNIDVGTLDVEGVELRLSPTPAVDGTLKIDGEEPPPGTIFSLTLISMEPGEPASQALVDKERHFTWKSLTPGKWTLDFAPKLPGLYLKSPAEVEIGPEVHAPIEVVISSQGAVVQGKVQTSADKATPVEAATVLLISDTGKVMQFAITDIDGIYTLSRIPPGKYRLLALEDIETNSWDNPNVVRTFAGKGTPIEAIAAEKSIHDLTLSQP
jgi:protocatechuate 3,4-dioxygenase beta subunit